MQKRKGTKYLADKESKRLRTGTAVPVTPPEDVAAVVADTQVKSQEEFRKFEAMLDNESFSKHYDTLGTKLFQGQSPTAFSGIPLLTFVAPNGDGKVATNVNLEKAAELLQRGVCHPRTLGGLTHWR